MPKQINKEYFLVALWPGFYGIETGNVAVYFSVLKGSLHRDESRKRGREPEIPQLGDYELGSVSRGWLYVSTLFWTAASCM